MFNISKIFEPSTLEQAIQILSNSYSYHIIAGGTDVLIKLRHNYLENVELVSLRKINDLKRISILGEGTISIGAMTSFADIFRSEVINNYIPILAEAAVSIGGPQIRNMATIGGNICNGAVSADSAPTLFVLNAKLKLVSNMGERIVPILDFYSGPGKVKLLKGEILKEILIYKEDYINKYGNYIKFANRKAMDIAMISVAVLCEIDKATINDIRISLGVAAPTPIRCKQAESFAIGKQIDERLFNTVGELTLNVSKARDSWRGSKSFREHLILNLTKRALKESIIRAGGPKFE